MIELKPAFLQMQIEGLLGYASCLWTSLTVSKEECPSYCVPVLVMRDATERPEGVDAGTLKLVGSNEEMIYKTFKLLLENEDEYNKTSHACIRDLAAEG